MRVKGAVSPKTPFWNIFKCDVFADFRYIFIWTDSKNNAFCLMSVKLRLGDDLLNDVYLGINMFKRCSEKDQSSKSWLSFPFRGDVLKGFLYKSNFSILLIPKQGDQPRNL